ncbi:hypothetical protein ASE08_14205 [Rhizobacter sp. Root16D2]|nr:hypothetical protein ASC88_26265 [Rhizobacter sp. Root29]KQW01005.1 hypothetical protein ASC98_06700 [Rhizobacter sp. Root1238]KRB03855.1 hypothetical protein ASE08_14205 [Rhizobacter sp. Root16D2]
MPHWRVLGGVCAALAGGAGLPARAGTVEAGVAVHIALTLPAGCSSSIERSAGGARVTLTCGANLFVNVRPVIVSAAAGGSAGPARSAANPAGGPGTPADGAGETVSWVVSPDGAPAEDVAPPVQVAAGRAVEMWMIF